MESTSKPNYNEDDSDDSEIIVVRRKKPASKRIAEWSVSDDDNNKDVVPAAGGITSQLPSSSKSPPGTNSPPPVKLYGLPSKTNSGPPPLKRRLVTFEQEDKDDDTDDTADTVEFAITNDGNDDGVDFATAGEEELDDLDNELRRQLNQADGKRRRRLLRNDELSESTRRAMDEEMARQKRIMARQKSFGSEVGNFNQAAVIEIDDDLPELPDDDGGFCRQKSVIAAVASSLVFEFDNDGKPLIQVHPQIAANLKPHQVEANRFLWDTVCESVEQLKNPDNLGSGAIVAHTMGLGKTLTTIAFVHAMLSNRDITGMRTCLILAPLNAQLNWIAEFGRWLPDANNGGENVDGKHNIDIHHFSAGLKMSQRALKLREWQKRGGVMVLGYTLYRLLVQASETDDTESEPEIDDDDQLPSTSAYRRRTSAKKNKKKQKKPSCFSNLTALQKDTFYDTLVKQPDIVVFDEGHVLKTATSALSMTLSRIHTRRRIILSGTPLQNNLMEYHCMVSFVKPGLLGTAKEFSNRFATPIKNGETKDSSEEDVWIMKRRISVLYRILSGFVHRRGFEHLCSALPPKFEYILLLRSTREQALIYSNYLEKMVGISRERGASMNDVPKLRFRLFVDYYNLRYVNSHPYLLYVARRKAIEEAKKEDAKLSLLLPSDEEQEEDDDDNGSVMSAFEAEIGDDASNDINNEDELIVPPQGHHHRQQQRRTAPAIVAPPRQRKRPSHRMMLEMPPTWYSTVVGEECAVDPEVSSKVMITLDLVRSFEVAGEKTLIFSQSLLFMDLIEVILNEEEKKRFDDEVNGEPPRFPYKTWRAERDYYRIDGSVNGQTRSELIGKFNNKDNPRGRLFLISTRAGGMGINLVAASRVIILDISWNPTNDSQALFRAYRFGQTRSVFVYRLVAAGTMEEKIYDRQVIKSALSGRVVDDKNILRHFTSSEILRLYEFDARENCISPGNVTDVSRFSLPKDPIFADLFLRRADVIKSYLDHDSLLAHQEHEQLSEDDRLAAWQEYEAERQGLAARDRLLRRDQQLTAANDETANYPTPSGLLDSVGAGFDISKLIVAAGQYLQPMNFWGKKDLVNASYFEPGRYETVTTANGMPMYGAGFGVNSNEITTAGQDLYPKGPYDDTDQASDSTDSTESVISKQ